MDYKPGDRVYFVEEGKTTTFAGTVQCNCSPWSVVWDNGTKSNHYRDELTPITSNKTMQNLLEKMRLISKGEPEKSFIKAGILNMDESFTTDGRGAFLSFLLKKNGDAFKTEVVDPILAEEEKE